MCRSRLVLLSVLLVAWFSGRSDAQVTAGVVVSYGSAGFLSTPPVLVADYSRTTATGIAAFVAVPLNSRVGLQAELSVPQRTGWGYTSSYAFGTAADSFEHRDVLLGGLLRIRAAGWCNLLTGGGVAFSDTLATSVVENRYPHVISTYQASANATDPVLTFGADFPIRVAQHFSILPTLRMHLIYRRGTEVADRLLQESHLQNSTFRAGVGGMLSF